MIELFPKDQVVGFFRGFREGGMEFHADLSLPYRTFFNRIPMHGQFLLVQLEHEDEAILGRITSLSSEGRLTGPAGEAFTFRAIREDRQIDERLREDYLNYKVNIRVLGVLRRENSTLGFVPSHRRLPHVGSQVAFPSDDVLRHIGGHFDVGADLGFLAFGEYIYAGDDPRLPSASWMQVRQPTAVVKFPVESLVARRTFVFARAGFGKSNLNKLLFSKLYEGTPTVIKRAGRKVPVGTIIFDPDGEYFWPDDKDRPGLCDVEELQNQLVVFTTRKAPSPFYGSFVAGDIKLDIRRLVPSDVISIALSPEKQDQQNVRKLKGLSATHWSRLVELIDRERNNADLNTVRELLHLEQGQDVEALAARANMTAIVSMLHDRSSQMMDVLLAALTAGKLCIVDLSQLRGGPSLILSGLILRRIFDRNQQEFTKAEPETIPTIAVVEEAQSVLNERASASGPYIEWVKEGRKYDLGAMLITQQPGSIPTEILSQGDNWFIFHLLSAADLQNVRKANAHFSEDLLSSLLNEPIPGQGVFWSSVGGRPYPISLRALSFEAMYTRQDIDYSRPAVATFAATLRERFKARIDEARQADSTAPTEPETEIMAEINGITGGVEPVDVFQIQRRRAIETLRRDTEFSQGMDNNGLPYGKIVGILADALPETMDDRKNVAYGLVPEAVSDILGGTQGVAWDTERRATKSGKDVTFLFKKS